MSGTTSFGALQGVRVVECCQGVGGPMLAMLLAEQGAEVIKTEPPEGDRLRRQPAFHVLNRSKRGLTLDFRSPAGRESLLALAREADVFLHDATTLHGSSEVAPLEAQLRAANQQLVIGYLPAYGSVGPWAALPADEALVQAVSGAAAAQWRYESRPVFINIPIGGYAQAIVGAGAVAAALYARSQTRRGSRFELSAVAAIFQFETTAFVKSANVQRLAGQSSPLGPIPTYRLFRASDGWLFVGALTPAFWTKLALATGLDDLLVDERFAGAPIAIPNMDDRKELARRLEAAFALKTRAEWMQALEEADVPRSLVLTREQWARDEQIAHNGMLIELDDPALGRTRQMGVPLRLHSAPGGVAGPAPARDNQASPPGVSGPPDLWPPRVLPTAGDDPRAATRRLRRHPLEGIKVLDLGTFIAGASCSMMLADFGAEVIKVEGPEGDAWRGSGLGFLGANRNKRGLCIDLHAPEGRRFFLEMVAQADVVLDNLRPGIMDRLGIDYAVLKERNPRIVHCSVTAYGPTGPRAHLPGFDPLMQAQGGVMWAQGDGSRGAFAESDLPAPEPVYLQIAVCDYATALTATYGIIAALVARERTGVGDRVETCLANSSLTVQAGEFIDYEGRPADPPGGGDLAGRNAVYRVYATRDGALMLACTSAAHVVALLDVLATLEPGGTHAAFPYTVPSQYEAVPPDSDWYLSGRLAQQLAATFEQRSTPEWVDALFARGVPVAPCVAVNELFDDEHLCANSLWWDTEDPRWGAVRQTGELIKWDTMSMALVRRAPKLGEHSLEVMREFGVAEDRIAALTHAGIVTGAL